MPLRGISTILVAFMQNKPNFRNDQMNESDCLTRHYKNAFVLASGQNKPNPRTPYGVKPPSGTPYGAISSPIQAQTNPIQTQFRAGRLPHPPFPNAQTNTAKTKKMPVYKTLNSLAKLSSPIRPSHPQTRYDRLKYHSTINHPLNTAGVFPSLEPCKMGKQIQPLPRLDHRTKLR